MSKHLASAPPTEGELAFGLAGLAEPAAAAPAAPAVRWLTDRRRVERYALLSPLAVGDVEYHAVMLKRMTGGEVAAFITRMRTTDNDTAFRFPLYFDERGTELPDAVWDALDDDDRFALERLADDFLPARFRPAADA